MEQNSYDLLEKIEKNTSKKTTVWEKWSVVIQVLIAFGAIVAVGVASYQASKFRESIEIQQAINRPFLYTHLGSSYKDFTEEGKIVVNIENTGSLPGRLLYKSTKLWIDNEEILMQDYRVQDVVYPNNDVESLSILFDIDKHRTAIEEKRQFKMGYCILYESATQGDDRKWMAQSWMYYKFLSKRIVFWLRDDSNVPYTQNEIDVANFIPEGWFEHEEPPWHRVKNKHIF